MFKDRQTSDPLPVSVTTGFKTPSIKPTHDTESQQKLYSTLTTVYACVRAISTNIAHVPLKFFRRKGNEIEDITDAPEFLPLTLAPNERHTIQEYNERYWGFLELTGEQFSELVFNNAGQLIELHPLRTDFMNVVTDKKGMIIGYSQSIRGQTIPLELEDIWYTNYWNPLNDIRGLSPLVSATQSIITDLQSITYNKSKLEEDVTPTGIFSAKGAVDSDEWERVKKAFKDYNAGAKAAGQVLYLDHDVTYETLSLSPKDMEYLAGRKLNKKEIREAFGVPPIFTQELEDSSVLQNTDVQERGFWNHNLVPKLMKHQAVINRRIKPFLTDDTDVWCAFDFSDVKALQRTEKDRLEAQQIKFGLGAVSPNELRELDGKETYPEGDKFFVDSKFIPIEMAGAEGELPKKLKAEYIKKGIWFKGFPDNEIVKIEKALIEILETENGKMETTVQKYFDEQGKGVNRRAEALPDNVFKSIQKTLEVDTIVDSIMERVLSDKLNGVEEWREETQAHIRAFVRTAGNDLIERLGVEGEIDMLDNNITGKIGSRLVNTSNVVWDTTVIDLRKKVFNVITEGIKRGQSIIELKENVIKVLKKYYKDITKHRAALIARTESQSMGNFGRMEAMRQNDFGFHTWATSADDRVRRGHADGDGQTVKIGDDFPVGRTGDYAGDKSFPSDINERCVTLPSTGPATA